jgi:hypothetical protein
MSENNPISGQRKQSRNITVESKSAGDFERMADFHAVISLAESTPVPAPPPDFTARVMDRLAKEDFKPHRKTSAPPLGHLLKNWTEQLTIPASTADVAACFFLAGFFYLALGICLHFGMAYWGADPLAVGWLLYQPRMAGLMATGFTVVGFLLLHRRRPAYRTATAWILCYILFSIANGVHLAGTRANPFGFAGTLLFTCGAVFMGIFLALITHSLNRWALPPPRGLT